MLNLQNIKKKAQKRKPKNKAEKKIGKNNKKKNCGSRGLLIHNLE